MITTFHWTSRSYQRISSQSSQFKRRGISSQQDSSRNLVHKASQPSQQSVYRDLVFFFATSEADIEQSCDTFVIGSATVDGAVTLP